MIVRVLVGKVVVARGRRFRLCARYGGVARWMIMVVGYLSGKNDV